MITGDQEAQLIQIVGEMERGVRVLKGELKHGNFTGSWDTARLLEVLVNLADQNIKTAGRENAAPPGDDADPAPPPG